MTEKRFGTMLVGRALELHRSTLPAAIKGGRSAGRSVEVDGRVAGYEISASELLTYIECVPGRSGGMDKTEIVELLLTRIEALEAEREL